VGPLWASETPLSLEPAVLCSFSLAGWAQGLQIAESLDLQGCQTQSEKDRGGCPGEGGDTA
jgi:hypothetical protein